VVGYVRVSTGEQALSGAGLDAQRAALDAAAVAGGWQLVEVCVDAGLSGRTMAGRPGLARAIATVESGGADALAVAKSDRLSRSVRELSTLLERAQRSGWSLVALDVGMDTATPTGEAMAHMLATFAQLERRLVGQRTREALAAKRAAGVRLGRPPVVPTAVRRRITEERQRGSTWRAIAAGLNADEIPTAHDGRRWWPSVVHRLGEDRTKATVGP
jgi:DNA invertase Pin-like site-specific DNA recombinase